MSRYRKAGPMTLESRTYDAGKQAQYIDRRHDGIQERNPSETPAQRLAGLECLLLTDGLCHPY